MTINENDILQALSTADEQIATLTVDSPDVRARTLLFEKLRAAFEKRPDLRADLADLAVAVMEVRTGLGPCSSKVVDALTDTVCGAMMKGLSLYIDSLPEELRGRVRLRAGDLVVAMFRQTKLTLS